VKKPAVFIDRDGTVNEQMGYINHISRFVLLPGVEDAIKLLNIHQYLVIIVTNQSGVARGYFPRELVDKVHDQLKLSLEKAGAFIDGIFYCPHYAKGIVSEYSIECDCRKPKPGLINKACEAFDIDMANSYVIGDRYSDIELALSLNMEGILVTTGYGLGDMDYVFPRLPFQPAYVAKDLRHAAQWIIERQGKKKEHF